MTKMISSAFNMASKDSASWNLMISLCKIIEEFIEDSDLHKNTNKLKDIIVRFDDASKHFHKSAGQAKEKDEISEFCYKKLYKIRYVFSKLGRLLNLHENEKI